MQFWRLEDGRQGEGQSTLQRRSELRDLVLVSQFTDSGSCLCRLTDGRPPDRALGATAEKLGPGRPGPSGLPRFPRSAAALAGTLANYAEVEDVGLRRLTPCSLVWPAWRDGRSKAAAAALAELVGRREFRRASEVLGSVGYGAERESACLQSTS